jgi:hypothetical protein
MNKIPINFLIGFLFGSFLSMAYYDGMVAKEYKEKILKSSDAIKRCSIEIEKKNSENTILIYYIDSLIKENEEIRKKISDNSF